MTAGGPRAPKVCLIKCPSITLPYPPDLALGYIKAAVRAAGYEARILDLNWAFYLKAGAQEQHEWLWTGDALAKHRALGRTVFWEFLDEALCRIDALLAEGFNVFGFSVWDLNRENSLELARLIRDRAPDAWIVFGGPECMPKWSGQRISAKAYVDAVVFGEGEETIVELLRGLEARGVLSPCSGAYVRTARGVVKGEPRPEAEPASLAFPDYADYFEDFDVSRVDRRLAVAFNRGCVWKCKFCSVPGYIPKFRWRPAKQIFEELVRQIERHSPVGFYESSPTSNSNLPELLKLCDMIARARLPMEWLGFGIFHPAMDAAAVQKLRASGCETMSFGLESGSQRVLDRMGKRFKIAHAERILRDMKAARIRVGVGLIVGYPGETEEDFLETMRFVERNAGSLDFVGSVSSMALGDPYAPIAGLADQYGLLDVERHEWHTVDGTSDARIRDDRRRRLQQLASSLGLYSMKHRAPAESD